MHFKSLTEIYKIFGEIAESKKKALICFYTDYPLISVEEVFLDYEAVNHFQIDDQVNQDLPKVFLSQTEFMRFLCFKTESYRNYSEPNGKVIISEVFYTPYPTLKLQVIKREVWSKNFIKYQMINELFWLVNCKPLKIVEIS